MRDRALFCVLFSTGLRIAEALALQRRDFEIGALPIATRKMVITGKGSVQRVVFFSPSATGAINEWLAARIDSDPRLFPMKSRAAQYMVKRRMAEAGMADKQATPHTWRHSFATDLLRHGVDLRRVQRFLGHASIATTMIYTHVVDSELEEIHNKLYE